jgi:hypothetical protein
MQLGTHVFNHTGIVNSFNKMKERFDN